MAFSRLKTPTSAFTFKTLLRHYAKRKLTNGKQTGNWDADKKVIRGIPEASTESSTSSVAMAQRALTSPLSWVRVRTGCVELSCDCTSICQGEADAEPRPVMCHGLGYIGHPGHTDCVPIIRIFVL